VAAALQEANTRLHAENAELRAENAELKAELAEQGKKLARLERLLSRNSGNSSMAPSGDDQPGKKPPEPGKRGGGRKRKPGKQPGVAGAHLEWNDNPDKTLAQYPEGTCTCGTDLEGARDLGVEYSHQVTDLPEAMAQTTQYDRHAVQCRCGKVHVADAPPEAGQPGTVTYGLNFQAWCVFLMVMHHVPVERCADILESMSGVRPSEGWVHSLLGRAAKAVAAANKAIRALIILARVVCGDETPVRAGPGPESAKKKYLHVACTGLLTCYFLGDRDLPSFKDFIYSDLYGTVIVHDRYQNYDAFDGVAHQLCAAHLLRDLEAAAQDYPGAVWPVQIADKLRALIHAANVARDKGLAAVPEQETAGHLRLFRHGVAVGLSQVPRVPGSNQKQPPARCLLECLKDREADVLRFLTDTAIPPTNNQAERDARPAKTQQKTSGRLRSEKTTRDRYAVRGYASTAIKHGRQVFTVIREALAGNAWIPPIPDLT